MVISKKGIRRWRSFPKARDEALREPAWEVNFEEVH